MTDGKEDIVLAESVAERGVRAQVESSKNQQVLNTPRTREACRKLGLVLEDLQYRPPSEFAIPGDLKEKQQLRFEHFEKRRKKRLGDVLAERAKVIAQNAQKGEVPGVQSGQFLSMLESLFEKEAKRLETDLKGQLRQHSSLVKENEEQLRKEGELQVKMMDRERKKAASQQHYSNQGQLVKANLENRMAKKEEAYAVLDQNMVMKQQAAERSRLAEEMRMERFKEEKMQVALDKNGQFRARQDAARDKGKGMKEELRSQSEQKTQEIQNKIQQSDIRRQEDQRLRQVRSEEQHLHLMDVRDAKNVIDRVAGYRRDELREQVEGNVERIETLLALKDQLLDQRKARNIKQEATKGSRGLNLRRDCLPGPGQYEAPESCLVNQPCGKIGKEARGGQDDALKAAKANPPPGAYEINVLANGMPIERTAHPVQFGIREKESYLDQAIKAKDNVPAPGQYEQKKTMLDHRGVKVMRDRVQDQGQDKFSSKRYPSWQRPSTETPGPAGYSVDDYMRKEVLRRAQRSLPNLTRDMLGGAPAVASH